MYPDFFLRATGQTSAFILRISKSVYGLFEKRRKDIHLDKTGICFNKTKVSKIEILFEDSEIIFPNYPDSLAHSLWRAQEFSLFRKNLQLLTEPILDFGCGDGSFASVLFERINYGIDIDKEALNIADSFKLYKNLLFSKNNKIPLDDEVIQSVFSNSVLEHVSDLKLNLKEISRVLRTGGTFIFSVPVKQFGEDIRKYFGKSESKKINAEYYHKNLLDFEEWRALLDEVGLCIKRYVHYQPASFTYIYLMLRLVGNKGLGRVFPKIRNKIWRKYKQTLVNLVKDSIKGAETGGNVFIIAEKLTK